MFGMGMPEIILILAIALIVIGPKKLPDLAKSLGRALGEFKKATREFKQTIEIDDEIKTAKETIDDINTDIRTSIHAMDKTPGETTEATSETAPDETKGQGKHTGSKGSSPHE